MTARERTKRNEGKRNRLYKDSRGLWSIGYGRCLDTNPLTDAECDYLFANDWKRALLAARSFHVYDSLNEARKGALTEMCFQMGRAGVVKFKRFLAAAERGEWDLAASEMLDSAWAAQTPGRARELADIFRTGIA